jgi:hypothetical protein
MRPHPFYRHVVEAVLILGPAIILWILFLVCLTLS